MPSKIQLGENLWFLYICLQQSDYKNIDFNAVGEVTNLRAPAARMRYTRLRRQIESGTLIGTHGTPFQRAAGEKGGGEGGAKRKRGEVGGGGGEGDDDEEEEGGVVGEKGREEVAKRESTSPSDKYDSDNTTIPERESEDEVAPLAKRPARQCAADTASSAIPPPPTTPRTGRRKPNIPISDSGSPSSDVV